MKRRVFLKFISAALLWNLYPFSVQGIKAGLKSKSRILVLLELKGGNDGLNTVVPYTDASYYRLRSGLAIQRDLVLPISDGLGLNPRLEPLMDVWKQKEIAIITGVGYPQPNRSHFRSIEIWETGSASTEYLQDGWLARLLPKTTRSESTIADGAAIGGDAGSLGGGNLNVVVMRNVERFFRQAQRVSEIKATTGNPALKHLLTVQNNLYRAATALGEKIKSQPAVTASLPKTQIGRNLATTAQIIIADVGIPVIKVSHDGFDTHANQRGAHDRLLQQMAEALAAFRKVMQEAGCWDRVLIMTYSEFGRRPAQNNSRGTDHGTAAPHVIMGGKVKGGLYGFQPSLTDLENQDLKFSIDYRRLYTTVARRWWGTKSEFLTSGPFAPIDCVKQT